MSLWEIGIWLVGTIGFGATVVLFLLYPAVLTTIWKAIIAFFSFVLTYRIGCAIVAAIITAAVVDYARHSYDDKREATRVRMFNEMQDDRDADIARMTRDEVWKEIADATALNTVTNKLVKDFDDALPQPAPDTGNPFLVGADACSLQRIVGKTKCEPQEPDDELPHAVTKSSHPADRPQNRLSKAVGGILGRNQKGK